MSVFQYKKIRKSVRKYGHCTVCGHKMTKQRTFWQVKSPDNLSPVSGYPKKAWEIRMDLAEEAKAWEPDFTHEECRPTYKIVRFYAGDRENEVIVRGLTLEQAQAHCQDRQTSSSTCTTAEGLERTELYGPWFDGYTEE